MQQGEAREGPDYEAAREAGFPFGGVAEYVRQGRRAGLVRVLNDAACQGFGVGSGGRLMADDGGQSRDGTGAVMSDDGHTVALPLTREQARKQLARIIDDAIRRSDDPCSDGRVTLDLILSAPPEVIAAAMGGWVGGRRIAVRDPETGEMSRRDFTGQEEDMPGYTESVLRTYEGSRYEAHIEQALWLPLPPRGDKQP